MFQLTDEEFKNLRFHFGISSWGGSRKQPYSDAKFMLFVFGVAAAVVAVSIPVTVSDYLFFLSIFAFGAYSFIEHFSNNNVLSRLKYHYVIDFLFIFCITFLSEGIRSPFNICYMLPILYIALIHKNLIPVVAASVAPVLISYLLWPWSHSLNYLAFSQGGGYAPNMIFAGAFISSGYFILSVSRDMARKIKASDMAVSLTTKLNSSSSYKDVITALKATTASIINIEDLIYMHYNPRQQGLLFPNDFDSIMHTSPMKYEISLKDVLDSKALSEGVNRGDKNSLIAGLPDAFRKENLFLSFHPLNTIPSDVKWYCESAREKTDCWAHIENLCENTPKVKSIEECSGCKRFQLAGFFVAASRKRIDATELELCRDLYALAGNAAYNTLQYELTRRDSQMDALTELPNRRSIMRMIENHIQHVRATNKECGIIMLDIDHFKKYNDTNGHPQGDQLLKLFSQVLNNSIRSEDAVGRYGGEEFIILLSSITRQTVDKVAEKIRSNICSYDFPCSDSQPGGRVTASIGVATYPHNGQNMEEIIKAADNALYDAKKSGRNRFVIGKY